MRERENNAFSIMSEMARLGMLLALSLALSARGVAICACDPSHPETLAARNCSLCREAEKQPPGVHVFFLKDINPAKPHRWLALPRSHEHSLAAMSAEERAIFWAAAIAKARELFPDGDWALALNGPQVVTQCHLHVHIGHLMEGVETDNFVTVTKPEEIPVPKGEGLWIHPQGNLFHVHLGEQITETVLLR